MDGTVDTGAFSGPGLLTKLLQKKGLSSYRDEPVKIQDISVYPLRYFYPYSWIETFSESCVTPDTFSVHLWEHTWNSASLPFHQKVQRKVVKGTRQAFARIAPNVAFNRTMHQVREGRVAS